LLLSIIIAIFNVEGYLEELLDSISCQNTNGIEILLIDDGSEDSSNAIADNYASMYDNILVIHKENGGVSSARNVGIENARGLYIWFVDGDDVIVEDCIDKLLQFIRTAQNQPEIVLCKFFTFNRSGIKKWEMKNIKQYDNKYINGGQSAFLWGESIFGTVWHYLFQRHFIISQNRFDENLSHNEDEDWLMSVLPAANSIFVLDEFIYKYRTDRPGSVINKRDLLNRFVDKNKIYIKWFDYFLKRTEQSDSNMYMLYYISIIYSRLGTEILYMDFTEKRRALEIFKKNKYISDYHYGYKPPSLL
jgi:glycosyltransferase involved in cell wall biosynthesis